MKFDELPEFKKDLKTLLKKYRTLNEDIGVVKLVLELNPNEKPPFSFRINNLGIETCIIKVKKIACKSLKGRGVNSGLRLVYAVITSYSIHYTKLYEFLILFFHRTAIAM